MSAIGSWPGRDRRAPTIFSPSYLHLRALAQTLRVATERLLPPGSPALVLDVGCSRKPYWPFFAGRCRRYIGVDLSAGPGMPDTIADAACLPFRDEQFDLVLSTQMIAYVDDPTDALREWVRVTRPGGHVLVTTHGLFPNMRDRWHFTDLGLHHLARRAGLGAVEVIPHGGAIAGFFQILALYLNLAIAALPWPLRAIGSALYLPINLLGGGLDSLAGARAAHFASPNFLLIGRVPERGHDPG